MNTTSVHRTWPVMINDHATSANDSPTTPPLPHQLLPSGSPQTPSAAPHSRTYPVLSNNPQPKTRTVIPVASSPPPTAATQPIVFNQTTPPSTTRPSYQPSGATSSHPVTTAVQQGVVPIPRSPSPAGSLPAQQLTHTATSQSTSSSSQSSNTRIITLDRGEDGLGFSIVGGFGSNLGDLPIYVKSVFEKGSASREGTLRRGDQILEVNGKSLKGLSHSDAVAVLKEAKGTVRLLILPTN